MFAPENSQTVGIIDYRRIIHSRTECFSAINSAFWKRRIASIGPLHPMYQDLLEAVKSQVLPEWVRYFMAVFTVTLYWNHILTIHDEVTYIWKRPFTEIKILFIVCRYMAAASFIVLSFVLSGLFEAGSDTVCRHLVVLYGFLHPCICMVADYVLMVRLYSLWDYRKHVIYVLRGAFVLCWGVGTMCMVLTMLSIIHAVKFDDKLFHMCLVPYAPRYGTGIWATQVVFELVVIVMTILNAGSRPSTIRVKIISDLIRDCLISNVGVFCEWCSLLGRLRFANHQESVTYLRIFPQSPS
ncbi:hypothetical protein BC834DRAFT_475222 [Gloeopeniophorella convolvens]|nr:hypothetical protein BC834DRAFT_475222 [Gloeopeniophorella convolvens]